MGGIAMTDEPTQLAIERLTNYTKDENLPAGCTMQLISDIRTVLSALERESEAHASEVYAVEELKRELADARKDSARYLDTIRRAYLYTLDECEKTAIHQATGARPVEIIGQRLNAAEQTQLGRDLFTAAMTARLSGVPDAP
jgi:hypothetical protein